MGFADLGCQGLEDPAAQDPQRLRIVLCRLLEESDLGAGPQGRVSQVGGQRVNGLDDHAGLVGQHLTRGQGGGGRRVFVAVELATQVKHPCGFAAGQPRPAGPPGDGVAGAGGVAELAPVGLGRYPPHHGRRPGRRPGRRVDQASDVLVRQHRQRQRGQRIQGRMQLRKSTGHCRIGSRHAPGRPPLSVVVAVVAAVPVPHGRPLSARSTVDVQRRCGFAVVATADEGGASEP